MNDEYLNDEFEIDLFELLKTFLKKIHLIFLFTLICGLISFLVAQFVLQKSYTSSANIVIIPSEESLDCTSYLNGNVVLNEVSAKLDLSLSEISESVTVNRDSNNYTVEATTNNPKLSYKVVNNIIKVFKSKMKSELDLKSITTVNAAQINEKPVSPNIKKITLIGTALGFIVSAGIVMLSFLFDKHLRNAEEAEAYLGVAVLGEIPTNKSNSAYRKLRTNIEYNKKSPNVQSICLTGAGSHSGTTTIACKLASILVTNHSKVLLIDCNLKKPDVQNYFTINNNQGLTNILINRDYKNISKYATDYKIDHTNNLLYVMGSGEHVENTLDLLSGKCFNEFILEMKKQFDFIVIDCPNLEDNYDAIPITHLVDGTILVLSINETDKNVAKESIERLNRAGTLVLGSVLNKME